MITSMSNKSIKNIVQLQKKAKYRKEQGLFVAEGIKMFQEIPKERLVSTYVSETFYQRIKENPEVYMQSSSFEIVSDDVFLKISDTQTPQGILSVVKQLHYSLENLLNRKDASLILLEKLQDPGNMGTILRSCEGAGITGAVIGPDCADIYNPKVLRSTMGSIYRVPFIHTDNLQNTILKLKKSGFTIFAAHLNGQKDYDKEDYRGRCGILIGNEASGLSEEAVKESDVLVRIPMEGKVESLNAAIAASVFMYEIYRQRRNE